MNTTELVKELGLPIALVLVGIFSAWKGIPIIWNYMVRQAEREREDRIRERAYADKAFDAINGIEKTIAQNNEGFRQLVRILENMDVKNRHN